MKKPIRHAVLDFLLASLFGFLIYILLDLLFLAPALIDTVDEPQSFLFQFVTVLGFVVAIAPFYAILLVLYHRKRQPKTEYLKQMAGRTYRFATDVKDLLNGEGKWHLILFAILQVVALVWAVIGIPSSALLTVTMPMAAVWLPGTMGLPWAIAGFVLGSLLFFAIFVLGVTLKHRKWCAERLSVN